MIMEMMRYNDHMMTFSIRNVLSLIKFLMHSSPLHTLLNFYSIPFHNDDDDDDGDDDDDDDDDDNDLMSRDNTLVAEMTKCNLTSRALYRNQTSTVKKFKSQMREEYEAVELINGGWL